MVKGYRFKSSRVQGLIWSADGLKIETKIGNKNISNEMLEYIVLYWSFFVLKMRNKYFCFNFIHNFCFKFERSDPLNV